MVANPQKTARQQCSQACLRHGAAPVMCVLHLAANGQRSTELNSAVLLATPSPPSHPPPQQHIHHAHAPFQVKEPAEKSCQGPAVGVVHLARILEGLSVQRLRGVEGRREGGRQ